MEQYEVFVNLFQALDLFGGLEQKHICLPDLPNIGFYSHSGKSPPAPLPPPFNTINKECLFWCLSGNKQTQFHHPTCPFTTFGPSVQVFASVHLCMSQTIHGTGPVTQPWMGHKWGVTIPV